MGCAMGTQNPRAFMDIAVDGNVIGRLTIEVREDVVPKTARNFMGLCSGEYENSYKGSLIYRVIPGFMAQGGDCGKSIYGKTFEDENFNLLHKGVGVLSMANTGPDTNGSQFFISFGDCSQLDGRHVVFGKVVQGKELLAELNSLGSEGGTTSKQISIANCGQL